MPVDMASGPDAFTAWSIGWVALALPIFFAARFGVARYRATIGERVRQWRLRRRECRQAANAIPGCPVPVCT